MLINKPSAISIAGPLSIYNCCIRLCTRFCRRKKNCLLIKDVHLWECYLTRASTICAFTAAFCHGFFFAICKDWPTTELKYCVWWQSVGGNRLLLSWGTFSSNLKSTPPADTKIWAFFLIYRSAHKYRPDRLPAWNFANLHLLWRCTTSEKFNSMRLVEAEIWIFSIFWLILVSEKCRRKRWRHHRMGSCVSKGILVNLKSTYEVSSKIFQPLRSYKFFLW